MSNLLMKTMTAFRILFFMVIITLTISCSSGGDSKLTQEFDEVPLSDHSSRITITSDLNQWSAIAGSMDLMCKCADLTVDRGFRYFYIDENSRDTQANERPSFRLTFYNTLPEGMSVVNPMTAIVYNGEWTDGYANGRGTLFYPDGNRYEGDWVEGKPHGRGVMITNYGDRYEGDLRNGREHGYGTKTYSNGVSYEGEWDNGRITGHGVFITKDGERHEGDFIDGTGSSSKGVYITPTWRDPLLSESDLHAYKQQKDRAMKESTDASKNSASDAKAEGLLDLCNEVRNRFSQQNKIYLDLAPR